MPSEHCPAIAAKAPWSEEVVMALADQKCVPCMGGVPPIAADRSEVLLRELGGDWRLNALGHLACVYIYPDFRHPLAFANVVGEIAESEGHHPDLHVGWGKCGVEIWTHKIDGLTESDFYLAAKADRAFRT